METKEIILQAIQDRFPNGTIQVMDNLIYVRFGRQLLTEKPLDFNTLEYYYNTNQLENHLKELSK